MYFWDVSELFLYEEFNRGSDTLFSGKIRASILLYGSSSL